MSPEIFAWFRAIGVPLAEVYGMSESSGPMTFTTDKVKAGTVGQAIPGCEVVIAEDGEVICRGGNVFKGYYKQPDKTDEAIIDGWLHSGDIGTVDEDGYFKIVDRKKDLVITAGGKNIAELGGVGTWNALKLVPARRAGVCDRRRSAVHLSAARPRLRRRSGVGQGAGDQLRFARRPGQQARGHRRNVQRGVDEINEQFAGVENIRKFTLLGEEWLPDTDLLTPTSKLKRRGILARYAEQIEAMYR